MIGTTTRAGGKSQQESEWIAGDEEHGNVTQTEPRRAQTQDQDLTELLSRQASRNLRGADGNASRGLDET